MSLLSRGRGRGRAVGFGLYCSRLHKPLDISPDTSVLHIAREHFATFLPFLLRVYFLTITYIATKAANVVVFFQAILADQSFTMLTQAAALLLQFSMHSMY